MQGHRASNQEPIPEPYSSSEHFQDWGDWGYKSQVHRADAKRETRWCRRHSAGSGSRVPERHPSDHPAVFVFAFAFHLHTDYTRDRIEQQEVPGLLHHILGCSTARPTALLETGEPCNTKRNHLLVGERSWTRWDAWAVIAGTRILLVNLLTRIDTIIQYFGIATSSLALSLALSLTLLSLLASILFTPLS